MERGQRRNRKVSKNQVKEKKQRVTRHNSITQITSKERHGPTAKPDSFHHQFVKSLSVKNRSPAEETFSAVGRPGCHLHAVPNKLQAQCVQETKTEISCEEKGVQAKLRDYDLETAFTMADGLGTHRDLNNNNNNNNIQSGTQSKVQVYTQTDQPINPEMQSFPPPCDEKSTQTSVSFHGMDNLQNAVSWFVASYIIENTQNRCSKCDDKQEPTLDYTDLAIRYSDINKLTIRASRELNKPPLPKNNNKNVSDEIRELMRWLDAAPSTIPEIFKQAIRDYIKKSLVEEEARLNSFVPEVAIDNENILLTDNTNSCARTEAQATPMEPATAPASAAAVTTLPARFPPARPSVTIAPSKMFAHKAAIKPSEPVVSSMRIGQLLAMPMPPSPSPPSPAVITVPPTMVSQARNEAPRVGTQPKLTKKNLITSADIALKRAKQNKNNSVQDGIQYRRNAMDTPTNIWMQEVANQSVPPPPPPQEQQVPRHRQPVAVGHRHHPYYSNAGFGPIEQQLPPSQQMQQQMRSQQMQQQMRFAQTHQTSRSGTPYPRTLQHQRQRQRQSYTNDYSQPGINEPMEPMPTYTPSYHNAQWEIYYND